MSAAILADAEAMELQARELLSGLHLCSTWDERMRVEDRIMELREGLPGRIVGFAGQYVEVQLDGDNHSTTCHATSEMEYPQGTRIGPDPDERFAHLVEVHPA